MTRSSTLSMGFKNWFRAHRTAMAADLVRASETIPTEDRIGREFPEYRRTFQFSGDFIDAEHQAIADLPAPEGLIVTTVQGFLRPADALTLYEMAYFATGDILEIGSAWGLSTTILCRAAANAARGSRVSSIELDPEFQRATAHSVASQELQPYYLPLPGDADQVMRELANNERTFSFVFVDHDHGYDAVHSASLALERLLQPGGIAVFHDFNDDRNVTDAGGYGVYRAVRELSDHPRMLFLGVNGCCALVHKVAR